MAKKVGPLALTAAAIINGLVALQSFSDAGQRASLHRKLEGITERATLLGRKC